MSDSYQEIEATLTEMESCLRLLFPEFTDIQITKSRSPNSQPANECPSVDEQPCCSKDLKDDGRERMMPDGEEKKPSVEEEGEKENNGMTEEKKGNREEKKEKETERRDGNEQEQEMGKETKEGDVEKGEREREREEEEDEEEEEEGHSEEEEDDDSMFIRSSGLISHSYSLDLTLSPGGYDSRTYTVCSSTLVYRVLSHTTKLSIRQILPLWCFSCSVLLTVS